MNSSVHPLLLRKTGGNNTGAGFSTQQPNWSMVVGPDKTSSSVSPSAVNSVSPNSPMDLTMARTMVTNAGETDDNKFRSTFSDDGRFDSTRPSLTSLAQSSSTGYYQNQVLQDDNDAEDELHPADSDVVDQRYDDDDGEMVEADGAGVSDDFMQSASKAQSSNQPVCISATEAAMKINSSATDNEYLRRLLDAATTIPHHRNLNSNQSSSQHSPATNYEAITSFDNFQPHSASSSNRRKSAAPQCARETLSPDGSDMLAAAAEAEQQNDHQQQQQQQQKSAIFALQQFAEAPSSAAFALDNLMVADFRQPQPPAAPAYNHFGGQDFLAKPSTNPSVQPLVATTASATVATAAGAAIPATTVRKNYCETCEQFFSTPSNFRKHLKTLVHITTKTRCEQQKQLQNGITNSSPIRSLLNSNNNNTYPPSPSFPSAARPSAAQQASAAQIMQARAAAARGGRRPAAQNQTALNSSPATVSGRTAQPLYRRNDDDSDDIICTGASFSGSNTRDFFNNGAMDYQRPNDSSAGSIIPPNQMNLPAAAAAATNVQQQLNLSLLALAMQTAVPNLTQQLTQQLTQAIATAVASAQPNNNRNALTGESNGLDFSTLLQSLMTSALNIASQQQPPLPQQQQQQSNQQQRFVRNSPAKLELQSPPAVTRTKKLAVPFFSNSDSPISASPILNHADNNNTDDDDDERTFQSPTTMNSNSNILTERVLNSRRSSAAERGGGENDYDDGENEDEEDNQLIIDEGYDQSASSNSNPAMSPSGATATTTAAAQPPALARRRRSLFNTSTGGSADGMESYKSPGGEIITIEEPLMLPVPVNAPAGDVSNRPCSIACRRCHKPFRTRTAYREHFRVVHVQHKPFSCGMCRKYFSCKSNYEKHLKTQVHRERDDIPSTSTPVSDGGVESPSNSSLMSPSSVQLQLRGGSPTKAENQHQQYVNFINEPVVATTSSASTTSGGMLMLLNAALNNNSGNSNKKLKFHDNSNRNLVNRQYNNNATNSPSVILNAALQHQQKQQQQQQQQQQQNQQQVPCFTKWRLKPPPVHSSDSPLVSSNVQQQKPAATSNSSSSTWVMSPAGNHQTPLSLMLNSPIKQKSTTSTKQQLVVPPIKIISSTVVKNGSAARVVEGDGDYKSKIQQTRKELVVYQDRQRQMQSVKRRLTDEVETMRTRHSDDVRQWRSLKGKLSWMDSYFNTLRQQLGDTAYQQIEDEVLAEQHAQSAASLSEGNGSLAFRMAKNTTVAAAVELDGNLGEDLSNEVEVEDEELLNEHENFLAV